MKMKMKLLDYTLISLLAGIASSAGAQEQGALRCTDEGCSSDQDELFRVRSDIRAAAPAPSAGTEAAQGGSKFSINLPGNGLIWATEDPNIGQPSLAVSAPSYTAYDGRKITKPIQFYVRSNYSAFVERYELTVYRGDDADLIEPLVRFPINVGAVSQTDWDGALPEKYRLRAGDELVYVLRAYDIDGNFDETYPRSLQLVRPEEAERGDQSLRESSSKFLGTSLTSAEAETQSLLNQVFSENGLRQQNIPIYGSRVKIQGRNMPAGGVRINGEQYPIDLESKFTAEYLVPVGAHRFDVSVGEGGASIDRTLDIDVTGRYFFGVALADVTVYQNKASGEGKSQVLGDRTDSVLTDARLAFYLKGKAQGKYLITAQADTTEREMQRLFTGFTQADPTDIFRSLDPDLYYPTYGDDSTVYRDVDTMGRFYLRVDWDKNQALWGNYNTGITGTEYAQYSRSLYGGALSWRSRATNLWGDPMTEIRAFGSEAQSAPGHTEFLGTGGSLYYLKHTNILPGSDKLVLEVTDVTSGRVETRVELVRGADYEIDSVQGRIILTRPLTQITRENVASITRETPLSGFEQRLLVDYEWVPSGFDDDNVALGFRGKQWLGNHVGIGATYIDENRSGDDFTIKGGDITLQAGKGTYIKGEYTETESYSAPIFYSDNGGFTFTQINPTTGPRKGNAKAIEARINLRELGWSGDQDISAGAWWREVSAGYSTARADTGQDLKEYGAEFLARFTNHMGLYGRYTKTERGTDSYTQAQLTGEWRLHEDATLTTEIRRVETRTAGTAVSGTLAALRYSHQLNSSVNVYGIGQITLDDDGGAYASNNALTLGGKYLYGNLSSIGAEYTTGDRGDAFQINAEHRINPDHTVYGSYTFSDSPSDYDSVFNSSQTRGWTVGQRWRLSNQTNLYNETQFLKNPNESGLANTLGMDFYLGVGWNMGFTLQNGDLTNSNGGDVRRKAVSVSAGRTAQTMDWQSKIEWRRDTGAERREQWVSTNRLSIKLDESWRLAARFNYSDTEDKLSAINGAKFIEGNVGFAYRPWSTNRWALFGRYSYLYDLSTSEQSNGVDYDQRSQILSLEGVYKPDARWEFAAKLARREGEARYGRGTGKWFDSATTFAALQTRYDLLQQWHALAEYRWLEVKDGGTRQGWLVGVDRDITRNFRIGVGYNFTDFSDDLTKFDYKHRGWFVNLVGTY
jgi:hypothetical protein